MLPGNKKGGADMQRAEQVHLKRANFYRWLSRLYRAEVDRPLLASLQSMRFPDDCADADLDAGYRQLQAWLADAGGQDLDGLAADYAKVFLGAGIAKGSDAAAFPFASVYTSPARIMMQEARDRAVETFARHGLCLAADQKGLPEDHLALMLDFMAWLCQNCHEASAAADSNKVAGLLCEQAEFLDRQLLNWVPKFCRDLEKHASTRFYQGVSRLTRGFLGLDSRRLAALRRD